jgi:pimeloyl-ACP methyl ester carboxylesterase
MRHITLGGRGVAVHVEEPSSPNVSDVVLVHGAGFDHTIWRYQTRFLAGHGHRVLAPDLPGHGRSDGPPLESIEAMADWLGGVIESFECGPAVLMGHSMGSYIALHRATSVPGSVLALVLVGTTDRMRVHPELLDAAAERDHHAIDLMIGWMHTGTHRYGGHRSAGSWSAGASRRTIERNLASLAADLGACERYDPTGRAAGVVHRTLIVSGSDDRMTASAGAGRLDALIGDSEHLVLAGAGHVALSERSEEVNAAIVEFVSRVRSP